MLHHDKNITPFKKCIKEKLWSTEDRKLINDSKLDAPRQKIELYHMIFESITL